MSRPSAQEAPLTVDRRARLARRLLAWLEQRPWPWCIVGMPERVPDAVETDIDIVVPREVQAGIARELLAFGEANGVHLIQRVRYAPSGLACALAWVEADGRLGWLSLDFCSDLVQGGRRLLSAAEILDLRTEARGFMVPQAPVAFAHDLLKAIRRQSLDEARGRHLAQRFREDPAEASALLARLLPEAERSLVERAGESGNWQEVRAALPALARALRRRRRPDPWVLAAELWRLLHRLRRPRGIMIVVLGPDGSGKSAAIEAMAADWAEVFRRVDRHHLLPRAPRHPAAATAGADPRGRPPYGRLGSLAKIVYLAARYHLGYLGLIRPSLVRNRLVLFDRYACDLLVDPERVRYAGPASLVRWLVRTIPPPDLILVLDAEPAVHGERKRELPEAELRRQREAYRALAEASGRAVIVDASRPPHEVRGAINAALIRFLHERLRVDLERHAR